MKNNDVKQTLKKLVSEILEIDSKELEDDSRFVDVYGADSITGIEILSAIEAQFGIQLPEDSFGKMTDMNSIFTIMQEVKLLQLDEVKL